MIVWMNEGYACLYPPRTGQLWGRFQLGMWAKAPLIYQFYHVLCQY